MLAISETAAEAITTLLAQGDLPDGSGARIAADGAQGLELALVTGPAEDDTVVRNGAATVYLEQQAAQVLDDKVLDVEPVQAANGEQELQFAIVPSQGAEGPA
jgi:Fe-S cluster assembly iron-binding protein IscA